MGGILTEPWHAVKSGPSDSEGDWRNGFESIGEIIRRLQRERRRLEQGIGPQFNQQLSHALDASLNVEDILLMCFGSPKPDASERGAP